MSYLPTGSRTNLPVRVILRECFMSTMPALRI